ncbi:hypothetical protein Scep_008653 [Stephania cephalantha]|uniref:Uncharacterized protein n=1 Tax=Stephania cephalantha TaxID=152367 RepID=A0AAP0KC39_9MAGN
MAKGAFNNSYTSEFTDCPLIGSTIYIVSPCVDNRNTATLRSPEGNAYCVRSK